MPSLKFGVQSSKSLQNVHKSNNGAKTSCTGSVDYNSQEIVQIMVPMQGPTSFQNHFHETKTLDKIKNTESVDSIDDHQGQEIPPNIIQMQIKKSDRPARPCPFCGKFKTRLTRHIKAVHKDNELVQDAIKSDLKEQRSVFKQCKRNGILKYNLTKIGLSNVVLERERVPKSEKRKSDGVVCDKCSGIFSRAWFYGHRKKCVGDGSIEPKPLPTSVFFSSDILPEEFKTEILSKFNSDEVGKLCQTDSTIKMIGSKLYSKIKTRRDKKTEVKRSIMADMRRLGTLFIHFKSASLNSFSSTGSPPCVSDMFHRRNYDILEEACVQCSSRVSDTEEKSDKSGLMISLYYLLIKAAKIIRVSNLVKDESIKAAETAEFLEVLAYNKNNLIGGAMYNNNTNRLTRLRRPQHLPRSQDLEQLRMYTITCIKSILDDPYLNWTSTVFVEVRDMSCSRLTLFNARRGGEPARLKLSDWEGARNKVWIDQSRVEAMTNAEKKLFEDFLIMYQNGKGVNHLVPVLVPMDLVPALEKMSDPNIRKDSGVREDNPYLFPSTLQSEGNVSGWHTISRVCSKAGVEQSLITATKMRHLASTMYANLDIPDAKRSAFYKHMGHSSTINENIYQAPLAEVEVLEVGSILKQFGNKYTNPSLFTY